jgi:hypothetical protein
MKVERTEEEGSSDDDVKLKDGNFGKKIGLISYQSLSLMINL